MSTMPDSPLTEEPPAATTNNERPTRLRLWPLAVLVAVDAAALSCIWLADLTRSWAVVYTGQTILLSIMFGLIWLACFSGLSRRMRAMSTTAIISGLALLCLFVRVDQVSGDMVPLFRWRFAAKPHEALAARTAEAASSETVQAVVDLTATTPRDYSRFLGEGGDGTWPDIQLARDWQAHPPREIWRMPIGGGWSAFAVVGDYLVTQEQRGPREMVVCYELLSGRMCWSHSDEAYFSAKIGGDGPRATPTVDQGRVYSMGATGLLNVLDGATGKPLWPARNVLADSSPTMAEWGKSCSPLLVDDLVVVTGGAERGPSLLAYSQSTGELVWKANDQPTGSKSYASPLLVELAGSRQIVVLNDNTVCGHDPATGRQLWEHPWPGDEPKATQPLPLPGDRLLVASGYGVGCALLRIERSEEGDYRVEELWKNRNLKPKFTNLVHRDGCVYGLDEGILVCLDLETGARRWKKGRYGHGQILLIDDLLLVQCESGEVALVEASPARHIELGRFTALSDKTWNHAAFAPPYLVVRNDREAACYQLELAPSAAATARIP